MVNAVFFKQPGDVSRTVQYAFDLDLVAHQTVENQISAMGKHSQSLGAIVS
ncbi:hypothetical protein D3C85_677480 [compost metagenome]